MPLKKYWSLSASIKYFKTISFGGTRFFAIISSKFPKHIVEQFLWKTQLLMIALEIRIFTLKTPPMKNGDLAY